jgi:hypothetical protein
LKSIAKLVYFCQFRLTNQTNYYKLIYFRICRGFFSEKEEKYIWFWEGEGNGTHIQPPKTTKRVPCSQTLLPSSSQQKWLFKLTKTNQWIFWQNLKIDLYQYFQVKMYLTRPQLHVILLSKLLGLFDLLVTFEVIYLHGHWCTQVYVTKDFNSKYLHNVSLTFTSIELR